MLTLESSHEDIIEEIRKLRVMYVLKTTLRYRSSRPDEYSESVGEHLFAMQVVAQYFLPLEDPQGKLDRVRISELILFHELGEIETGDIIFHRKTDADRADERLAAERVSKRLPQSMQRLALERVREFEECETPEARFVFAVDKIEPIFEMFEEKVLPLFKKQHVTRHDAVAKKHLAAREFPYMQKFVDAWEARAVSLDVFPE